MSENTPRYDPPYSYTADDVVPNALTVYQVVDANQEIVCTTGEWGSAKLIMDALNAYLSTGRER
jgi:hypothetical protein